MNPRVQEWVDRIRAIDLTDRQRRLATWIGYPLFGVMVALFTFYTSIPTDRIKDRLETALSADVTSGQPLAIGMDVSIGGLVPKLFTGVGFKASDIVLRTRPLNPTEKPARYVIDDVRVRLGLFSTLFGRPSYSFKAHALDGTILGDVSGNNDGTHAVVEVEKAVLTGVPGIQQALGGIPLGGTVNGKLDVTVPKNLLANADGSIDLEVADAVIGDGKAKLTVPSDPFLAAGITFPRIRLGQLTGQIVIEKGRARFENVRIHSADADLTIEGYAELHDPIGTSQLHAYVKFRPSEALTKREPTIELMTQTLNATARRSDGFYGLQLTGPLASLFVLPSKDPPFGVTSRNEPAAPPPRVATPPAVAAPSFVPPPSPPPVAAPSPSPPPAAAPPPANEPPPNSANEPSRPDASHGEAPHEAHAGEQGAREIPPPAANAPAPGTTAIPPPPPGLRAREAEPRPGE